MRRRNFISLVGGAAAWPLATRAQQGERMRRVGVLMENVASDEQGRARFGAFLQRLHELGWNDDRIVIDDRWAAADADRFREYAAELVALLPDVVLAASSAAVMALQHATRTVPIVFTNIADPVSAGIVASLAHPGGNATGFLVFEYGLSAKWLELLKEIAPAVKRVLVLRDPTQVAGIGQLAAMSTSTCDGLRVRRSAFVDTQWKSSRSRRMSS